ncbi:MAG: toxin-antitoxin system YwqK family antitoxin, partial [Thermoguttaceae bacterium]
GILMLLGIVVAIVALQRNLRDINRVATDRHTVEANDTKPTAESKPLLAHNNPPKSKKENHWDGNSTRPIFKTTPKKPVEKREPPALPENESPKIEDALQLDFQPQNNNLPINNPQTVQPVKMLDLALDNLPSGKKFAADVFNTDMGEVNRLLNADLEAKQLLIAHYPNGNTVLAAHKHGVLDGVCIFFTKKGKPTALINYRNGLLQGVAKTWNEQGERLLCFEYAHGARNGFCCYYKDGRFRLLLEIYANKIRGVYLISSGLVEKSVDHAKLDDLDADAKDLVKEARTRIYSAFNRNEKILKMQCAEEYMRLQRELANLMRSKGLKAVENRVRDYNNQCKKRIDSLGKYEFLKKSVW